MSYLGPPEALREADGHIAILPSDGFHPAARESSPLSQLWLAHACIHENTFHDYAQLLMTLCLERKRPARGAFFGPSQGNRMNDILMTISVRQDKRGAFSGCNSRRGKGKSRPTGTRVLGS